MNVDTFSLLYAGMESALAPANLLFALIGVMLGTAIGILPGIGPAMTVALLLPITFKLDPRRLSDHVRRASTTAACMAARRRRSFSILPARDARSLPPSKATRWRSAGRGGPALATAAIGSFHRRNLCHRSACSSRAMAR